MKQHYPDQEERLSRESCTRRLVTMCEKLDRSGLLNLPQKRISNPNRKLESLSEVESMWVYGSYARGALDCGDIDVIVKLKRISGCQPTAASLIKEVWGGLSRVRVHIGEPENNFLGVDIHGAKLIWERGMDWRLALESITPDPEAGRYERKSNAIPFRNEQIDMYLEDMEAIVDMRDQGLISWEFIGISKVNPADDMAMNSDRNDIFREVNLERCSLSMKELSPYIIGYVDGYLRKEKNLADWRSSGEFDSRICQFGGTVINHISGRPQVEILDSLSCKRLAVIPKLEKRGPNGFWVIERGPNHPLRKMFENTSAWTIESASGKQYFSVEKQGFWKTLGIDMSTDKDYIEDKVRKLNLKNNASDFPLKRLISSDPFRIVELSGNELLDRISMADFICLNKRKSLTFSRACESFLRDKLSSDVRLASPEEISLLFKNGVDLLSEKKRSSSSLFRP